MSAHFQATSGDSVFRLKNILVPTDFSSESIKALRYGAAFAQQFAAVLSLVHVVEPPPAFAGFESIPIVVDETEPPKNAERQLASLLKEVVPLGIAVSPLALRGSPFEQIVSIAKARKTDLIVASTHGHTGLKRVLFGSTTERIVQRAPCPVLVVRQREHEFVTAAERPDKKANIRLNRILVPTDFSDCSKKALQYAMALAKTLHAEIFCIHVLEIPYATGETMIVTEMRLFKKASMTKRKEK